MHPHNLSLLIDGTYTTVIEDHYEVTFTYQIELSFRPAIEDDKIEANTPEAAADNAEIRLRLDDVQIQEITAIQFNNQYYERQKGKEIFDRKVQALTQLNLDPGIYAEDCARDMLARHFIKQYKNINYATTQKA